MIDIRCTGPGPHAPEDGFLGSFAGSVAPAAMCAACVARLPPAPPPSDSTTLPDVAALARELDAQRVRLNTAEDALDHLIVASLDGSL